MDILKVLREIKEDEDFTSSNDFLEDGLLDSFDIVNLVSALEEEFQIEISGRDIVPENFVNLAAIENVLKKYVK